MCTSDREETLKRLEILKNSNDGFKIAEEDLKLRGPGDMFGIRQSGDLRFKLADIYSDAAMLKKASEDATAILKDDPKLIKEENAHLRQAVDALGNASELGASM
jgi:ATP-dependent DNA helicase RecG